MNRETIYGGLFNKLVALPGFVTKDRLLKHWTDVSPSLQPALYQAQGKETAITVAGQPTKWELRLSLYVYVHTDGITPPGTLLNPLLDAITNAVQTRHPITGKQDMGIPGVEWARIDGTIETDEGTLGQQAVAIIPILIFATD